MSEKTGLLCIGNAIVDAFIEVEPSFLIRHGISEPVQHVEPDRVELILNEISSLSPAYRSGGGAANVAKVAAMLGVNARYAGSAGGDWLSGIFTQELESAGANVSLYNAKGETGICFICKSPGGTYMAACPRAAAELPESFIDSDLIDGAKVVVLDGYMLDRGSFVWHVFEKAGSLGIPVALDASSTFIVQDAAWEILHYSRNYPMFVFMNADEAIAFYNAIAGKKNESVELSEAAKEAVILRDVCPMLKIIAKGDFPVFAVKMGSRGALAVTGGKVFRKKTTPVLSDNTVGAGDNFCAAFLSAWLCGKSAAECTSFGNKAARAILGIQETAAMKEKLSFLAKTLIKRLDD
jgi:sugar/nucleoside kinase (ribokinase family)